MSIDAELFAVGPYTTEIGEKIPYYKSELSNTKVGTLVLLCLFSSAYSSQARELLQIFNGNDFGQRFYTAREIAPYINQEINLDYIQREEWEELTNVIKFLTEQKSEWSFFLCVK